MLDTLLANFLEIMDKGGPVMWIIFITAWLAIIMLVERFIRINSWEKQALIDQFGYENNDNYRPQDYYTSNFSPISMLASRIDWDNAHDKSELVKQIKTQMGEITPKLEGSLPTIAVIGSILPMLGLLGTVTGMINVFDTIAIHGSGNPQQMAGGISQALLTTASGLIIAIPVIFAHHILSRRLRHVLTITDKTIQCMIKQAQNRHE